MQLIIKQTLGLFMLCLITMGLKAQTMGPDTLVSAIKTNDLGTPDSIILNVDDFGNMVVPWHGKVISKFGPRRSRMHTGTDVKLLKGDTVRCAFDGIVEIDKAHYGYGLLVTVNHAHGITTYYGHLSKILVKKGQTVKAGDVVGLGGQTGRATTAHLHFELRVNGKPVNSQQVFDFENNTFLCKAIVPSKPKSTVTQKPSTDVATANPSLQPAAAVAGNDSITHTIKKGDTLYKLAKTYGTSVNNICALNGISARTTLKIGNELKIR